MTKDKYKKIKAANDKYKANEKFYETGRPRSWKGGSVSFNQTKPKDGSRKAFDPSKVTDRQDFDYKDAKVSKAFRSGEMETYAARKAAFNAANRAEQKLTRAPRAGTAGLKSKKATPTKVTAKVTPKKSSVKKTTATKRK